MPTRSRHLSLGVSSSDMVSVHVLLQHDLVHVFSFVEGARLTNFPGRNSMSEKPTSPLSSLTSTTPTSLTHRLGTFSTSMSRIRSPIMPIQSCSFALHSSRLSYARSTRSMASPSRFLSVATKSSLAANSRAPPQGLAISNEPTLHLRMPICFVVFHCPTRRTI